MKKIAIVLFTIILTSSLLLTEDLKLNTYWEGSLEMKDASELGYKDSAFGVSTKLSFFLKKVGFYFNGLYSTAQKKSATRGYALSAQIGIMYCIHGGGAETVLSIRSGI